MSKERIIALLNELTDDDPESAHIEADQLLIDAVRLAGMDDVADAFNAADERVGFWYA